MKRFILTCLLYLAILFSLAISQRVYAQGTAFTYQGRLDAGGSPVTGAFDMTFKLSADSGGISQVGNVITNLATPVSNGLFTVTLDFGGNFPGATRWLQISVRTNGSAGVFTALTPAQAVSPTPYSIQAENAAVATMATSAGSVAASNLTGQILNSALPVNPSFTGTVTATAYSGNGGGLTNILESSLNTAGTLALTTNGLAFTNAGVVTVGNGPTLVIPVTNLNGLGRVDLLVANSYDNTVSALTNNGSGGFGVLGTYPVGPAVYYGTMISSLAVVDVNNDGKPDFVVADTNLGAIIIYTNNGAGFGSNATLTFSGVPSYIATLDVNNDGRLDLLCANMTAGNVMIYTNNRNGGFGFNSTVPTGRSPSVIAIADINGDGRPDLIVANSGTNTVTLLINNGNGTFFSSSAAVCASNANVVWIASADFNRDNYNDLASLNSDGSITVLTNTGSGSFVTKNTITGLTGTMGMLATSDLNLDGYPELIAGTTYSVDVFLGSGTGFSSEAFAIQPYSSPYPPYYGPVAAVDLNGDGYPDLVLPSPTSLTYYGVYPNDSVIPLINVSGSVTTELELAGQSGGLQVLPGLNGTVNVEGGSGANLIDGTVTGSVIDGGGSSNNMNRVSSDYSVVGGGEDNRVGAIADHSVVSGGKFNTASGEYSTVGGGLFNTASGFESVVSGGGGYYGGDGNLASGSYSTVPGGYRNTASGSSSFAAGYGAAAQNNGAFVWADSQNGYASTNNDSFNVRAAGGMRLFIGSFMGGINNSIGSQTYSAIVEGQNNVNLANNAFIGSGTGNNLPSGANGSFIGAGQNNSIGTGSIYSAVVAGEENTNNANQSFIGSGVGNLIVSGSYGSVIGGGQNNAINGTSTYSVIAGGQNNTNGGGLQGAIGGGYQNVTSNNYSTVPGGFENAATGTASFAAGAYARAAQNGTFVWGDDSLSTPFQSTAVNQFLIRAAGNVGINTTTPGSELSVVQANAGGRGGEVSIVNNAAPTVGNEAAINFGTDNTTYNGDNGNAQIKARSVNINNASDLIFSTWNGSTFGERMRIQNGGNVGIGTSNPTNLLQVGSSASPAYCNGSSWVNSSDRNAKQNFMAVDPAEVLQKVSAMPITQWQYKAEAEGVEHLGPMAQDFHEAFGLNGSDDKHIATIDESGVALAAIQGLNQKVESRNAELEKKLAAKDGEIAQLRQSLAELKAIVSQLNDADRK